MPRCFVHTFEDVFNLIEEIIPHLIKFKEKVGNT
jgi:hypothetical protein